MNIAKSEHEQPVKIVAKMSGNRRNGTKVIYSFIDAYHSLCVDKKDIISSELEACESLLRNTRVEQDRKLVEIEIAELKMALDLMP